MLPNGKSESSGTRVRLAKIDGGLSRLIWSADGPARVDTWSRAKGWTPGGASADEFMMAVSASDRFMSEIGLSPSEIAAARRG